MLGEMPAMRFGALDRNIVSCVEGLCRRYEHKTGRTNYFFLRLISGLYACFVLTFVVVGELTRTAVGWDNVSLFLVSCCFFYVALRYGANAEMRSIERHQHSMHIENPKKTDHMFYLLRMAMLANLILLILFLLWLAVSFSHRISEVSILLYMSVSLMSSCVIWSCLVLDACDPTHASLCSRQKPQ